MASSRRQYPFHLIEPKWQKAWDEQEAFRAFNPGDEIPATHPFAQRHKLSGKVSATQLPPKFYILDMFPYPSGAGLHVGHPEGYTATDILARYKRAQGFHVLHPMGWDAFGLPAEQYAVKTGQHPRQTTDENIATFKRQIKSLGFSYDWSREVATTDPDYFKWTQWIFLKLYNSYFDQELKRAMPISLLEDTLSEISKRQNEWAKNPFLSQLRQLWQNKEPEERTKFRQNTIQNSRLAYVAEAPVWWCEALGTVLANEEVVDGKSEVGGHDVVKKPLRQWMLRITAYAERLLQDLETIEWSDALKQMQRNWIGKSEGATVLFYVRGKQYVNGKLTDYISNFEVFTTRPDTLFGATYVVLSPEHPQVESFTTPEQRTAVQAYKAEVAKKSDLERTDLAKEKTGVFTGAYAINPVNNEKIPIWIADYVLASYGTGAIMAVPAHDERDYEFAKQFKLPIKGVVAIRLKFPTPDERTTFYPRVLVVDGKETSGFYFSNDACVSSEGHAINSFNSEMSLDGLPTAEAKKKITDWLEAKGLGKRTINYKLRDWLFSRQRYWGEPFPIIWKKDASGNLYHEALHEAALPLLPPPLDDYKPTPDGQPPLARAKDWVNLPDGSTRETNTMPQWAGSCWYYLRYLDAKNAQSFVGKDAEQYWMGSGRGNEADKSDSMNPPPHVGGYEPQGVDLYVGGTEHAVLHLLYARFWHKVLYDLGYVSTPEPFFKLVNQGLILGEDGQKMSKSRGNVVNPDDILKEFGADAFRLYEMFMGPLQDTKPWSTKGVEGVYRFLGRVWRLFVDEKSETEFEQAETLAEPGSRGCESAEKTSDKGGKPADARVLTNAATERLNLIKLHAAIKAIQATSAQLKTLHACIKKVTEDLDGMRFNTAISAMMEFVNAVLHWETKPVAVLQGFLILLQPFAPHLAEELWQKLSSLDPRLSTASLAYAPWPKFNSALLVEETKDIKIQREGKIKAIGSAPANADEEEITRLARTNEEMLPQLEDRAVVKIITRPDLVNFVTKSIGPIAEKVVENYLIQKGEAVVKPTDKTVGCDFTLPNTGALIEVKATGDTDWQQIYALPLSANQYRAAEDAKASQKPFELHLITGVNPDTGSYQNHYCIPGQTILDQSKRTKTGWILPVSGAFDSFKVS